MNNEILVVVKDPGKPAVQKRIPNTLDAFQREVDGYIETVRIGTGVIAVVNEEGRLRGLPESGIKGLVGTVVFCADDDDEFAGLKQADADLLVEILP